MPCTRMPLTGRVRSTAAAGRRVTRAQHMGTAIRSTIVTRRDTAGCAVDAPCTMILLTGHARPTATTRRRASALRIPSVRRTCTVTRATRATRVRIVRCSTTLLTGRVHSGARRSKMRTATVTAIATISNIATATTTVGVRGCDAICDAICAPCCCDLLTPDPLLFPCRVCRMHAVQ